MDPGAMFILLVLFIILGIALMAHRTQEEARRKAEKFREGIKIDGSMVILPRRMGLVKGRLILKGHWSSTGKSRHYSVDREFTRETELKTDRIELKPERFSLVMNRNEDVLIDVPAYLVTEPEFENTVVIPINPSYRFELDRQSLEASKDMEFAHARIELTEWGFSGKLYATVQKCRGARLELKWKDPDTTEKLAETSESAEFRREFMREKFVIISNKNVADPRSFKRLLGNAAFMEGHGEYAVELTLDVPLGSDVHDRATLRAEPGAEVPEGETRVEVVV